MEKGPGGPVAKEEVLVMDEPRKPAVRVYLLFCAIFVSITLLVAANWGYLSELAREDMERPTVSPVMTGSSGFTQRIKFTVKDDVNLPMKVGIRVHYLNSNEDMASRSGWTVNYTQRMEVPQGTTMVLALRDLPRGHIDRPYIGWYVWVDATDFRGKNTTAERAVFPGENDPDW